MFMASMWRRSVWICIAVPSYETKNHGQPLAKHHGRSSLPGWYGLIHDASKLLVLHYDRLTVQRRSEVRCAVIVENLRFWALHRIPQARASPGFVVRR